MVYKRLWSKKWGSGQEKHGAWSKIGDERVYSGDERTKCDAECLWCQSPPIPLLRILLKHILADCGIIAKFAGYSEKK